MWSTTTTHFFLLVIEGADNNNEDNEEEEDEKETEEEEEEKEDTIYVNTEGNDENEGAQGAPDEAPNEHDKVQRTPYELGTSPNKDEGAPNNNDEPPKPYNLPGHPIDYGHGFAHQFTQLDSITPQGPQSDIATNLQNRILAVSLVFNQMGAKAGVKKYGNKAIEAIVNECKQLDDRKAFKPRNIKSLTNLKQKRALQSITLVKETLQKNQGPHSCQQSGTPRLYLGGRFHITNRIS
jgi:hypothetical protein